MHDLAEIKRLNGGVKCKPRPYKAPEYKAIPGYTQYSLTQVVTLPDGTIRAALMPVPDPDSQARTMKGLDTMRHKPTSGHYTGGKT